MDSKINNYFEQMHEFCSTQSKAMNPFPFNRAQMTAYQDWVNYKNNNSNYYECDDLPWADEVSDYAKIIRDAGIHEIAITDHSSNLMNGLHAFKQCGYDVVSLCKVTHNEKRWNGTQITTVPGILLHSTD